MNLPRRVNAIATRAVPVKLVRSHLDRAVASITFDDFPRSAWHEGRAILDRYGAKATYYAAGVYCNATEDGIAYYTQRDLTEIGEAGHEVGCHTFSHQHGTGVASPSLIRDTDRNQAFIASVLGDYSLTSFAYPYGDVSPRTKLLLAGRFATSRGIRPGVNAGLIDLAQLNAIGLESRAWSAALVERAVDEAVRRKAWIIFFTHDIDERPSPYGATPAMLDHALAAVTRARMDIIPVKHALARAIFQ
jgi:peptidoglycan/xylan/chitin deacetylase (PgdA/CDA1 family)